MADLEAGVRCLRGRDRKISHVRSSLLKNLPQYESWDSNARDRYSSRVYKALKRKLREKKRLQPKKTKMHMRSFRKNAPPPEIVSGLTYLNGGEYKLSHITDSLEMKHPEYQAWPARYRSRFARACLTVLAEQRRKEHAQHRINLRRDVRALLDEENKMESAQKRKDLEMELVERESKSFELENEVAELEAELADRGSRNTELGIEIAELNEKVRRLQAKNKKLKGQKVELKEVKAERDSLKEEIVKLNTELNKRLSTISTAQARAFSAQTFEIGKEDNSDGHVETSQPSGNSRKRRATSEPPEEPAIAHREKQRKRQKVKKTQQDIQQ